jgi:uroporphyrinogen-III decarboxylase
MPASTTSTSRNGSRSGDRLAELDFAAHNATIKSVWDAYHRREPVRPPMILGTNSRYFMLDASANPSSIDFRQYIEDAEVMFDCLLRFQRWSRFNLLQDAELGLHAKWTIGPDFQNFYEAAWFGCDIEYMDGQVPDTRPAFAADPERVMAGGLPDPFGGLMGKARQYHQRFKERAAAEEYLGRPIAVNVPGCGLGTDGPMTVACNLFGPDFVCAAMLEEPERLRTLLAFITDATIARIRAWRQYAGLPATTDTYGFADDSVALISRQQYIEHILPHHRRLCDAIGPTGPRSIHLCGDSTRHFTAIRDELRVNAFDTGFPVDFAKLRSELGPDVQVNGGPHVELLLSGTPTQVRDEARRILASGICRGGRFVLREGNNLAPHTPPENTEAMYYAVRELETSANWQTGR